MLDSDGSRPELLLRPDVVVEGPVTGARPPYGAPPDEVLDAHGYVCQEFRLAGRANAYTHDGPDGPAVDGRWSVHPFDSAPYRTRLLVLRPRDAAAFTGTVFLEWQNVSAGHEQPAPAEGEVFRGHAWVGVSVQEAGLDGGPGGGGQQRGGGAPLLDADPERYADLVHPGEPACFDMFSAGAVAVGPDRPRDGVDPMGGLPVARVVALGGSQSAMRLVAYANAIHPLHDVVDGFVLHVWEGRAPRVDAGAVSPYWQTTVRSDLGVPVLVVNSEFEVTATHDLALDDGERLRVWEVAGTAHGRRRRVYEPAEGEWGPNPLTWRPVYDGALRAVHRWLADGEPPSVQPRIAFADGSWPTIARDADGNAVGGVRLPELAAPLAEYRGRKGGTGTAVLFGGRRPFSPDLVRSLYASREVYLGRWRAAVEELVAAGVITPEDGQEMLARGAEVAASLPLP